MKKNKVMLSELQQSAEHIRREFDVKSLCVFGSVARNENTAQSDIDICVDMPPKMFKVLALKTYLQELLHLPVDLVRRSRSLDSFLLKQIERDAIYVF